jgi:riboflavin kinase/FMN adenylyltransferase
MIFSQATEEGYAKIIRVDLLYKLHDELRHDGLTALAGDIARGCAVARAWLASRTGRI